MILKTASILFTLLAYFILLAHDAFPHHHEELKYIYSVNEPDDKSEHKHQNGEHHYHHDSQKEEKKAGHNHPFPGHHHISESNDIYITRTNLLELNNQIIDVSYLVFNKLFRIEFFKPPNIEGKLYEVPQFLITSLSYLEAFALRGPPAIA